MDTSDAFFPAEYTPFLTELTERPENERELFRYTLAVMMIDDGKAKIADMQEENGRLRLLLETPSGDKFLVVRPEISEETDQKLFNQLRRIIQEETSGTDGSSQKAFLLDAATLRRFTKVEEAAFDYAWEKLHLAVLQMAQSPETLQQRLYHAYRAHLVHLRGQPLPGEISKLYEGLETRLSALLESGDGGGNGFATLSDVDCSRLIVGVIAIYDVVTRYQPHD